MKQRERSASLLHAAVQGTATAPQCSNRLIASTPDQPIRAASSKLASLLSVASPEPPGRPKFLKFFIFHSGRRKGRRRLDPWAKCPPPWPRPRGRQSATDQPGAACHAGLAAGLGAGLRDGRDAGRGAVGRRLALACRARLADAGPLGLADAGRVASGFRQIQNAICTRPMRIKRRPPCLAYRKRLDVSARMVAARKLASMAAMPARPAMLATIIRTVKRCGAIAAVAVASMAVAVVMSVSPFLLGCLAAAGLSGLAGAVWRAALGPAGDYDAACAAGIGGRSGLVADLPVCVCADCAQ